MLSGFLRSSSKTVSFVKNGTSRIPSIVRRNKTGLAQEDIDSKRLKSLG
jgi:hypothetical protein